MLDISRMSVYQSLKSAAKKSASKRKRGSTLRIDCWLSTGVSIMAHTIHDIGVASQIGSYSDAVEAGPNLRWLLTSGTPGLSVNGKLPKDITGQAELAWEHILRMLDKAGMTVADVLKVTQYLT